MPKVTCVDIEGNKYEVDSEQLTWRPSAYGIVFNKESVLLSPQFEEGRYDLPGGGLDFGELPNEAVIREVKEETGLVVNRPKLIACESNFFKFRRLKDVYFQTIMLYYSCKLVGGELSTSGFDEFEKNYARIAEWVPVKKLSDIKIANSLDFRPFINEAYKEFHAHTRH